VKGPENLVGVYSALTRSAYGPGSFPSAVTEPSARVTACPPGTVENRLHGCRGKIKSQSVTLVRPAPNAVKQALRPAQLRNAAFNRGEVHSRRDTRNFCKSVSASVAKAQSASTVSFELL
jgi:hypothetical protein